MTQPLNVVDLLTDGKLDVENCKNIGKYVNTTWVKKKFVFGRENYTLKIIKKYGNVIKNKVSKN